MDSNINNTNETNAIAVAVKSDITDQAKTNKESFKKTFEIKHCK